MLLGLSGEKTNNEYNLSAVTGVEKVETGVPNESILIKIAEAVYYGNADTLAAVRKEAEPILGPQALVDAIAVAAGFNGITKVANGTGLPLDEATENSTVEMRQQTKIDDYTDAHKKEVYQ